MKVFVFDLLAYGEQLDHLKVGSELPYPLSNRYFKSDVAVRTYAEHLDAWEEMDRLGYDGVGFNEHHCSPYGLMNSPNLMAAAAAQRTKKLKLLIYGNLLPLHEPLRLAEELAMLDCLSNGRLISGFARGIPREYQVHNVPLAESRARFEEAYEIVTRAWTEDVFSYEGKFWSYKDVAIWPRPVQQPQPGDLDSDRRQQGIDRVRRASTTCPITPGLAPRRPAATTSSAITRSASPSTATGSRPTICRSASPPMSPTARPQAVKEMRAVSPLFQPHAVQPRQLHRDREAARGRLRLASARPIMCGRRTMRAAQRAARGLPQHDDGRFRAAGRAHAAGHARRRSTERIIAAAEAAGANKVQISLNRGALPHEMFMEQIRRFAREVLPALQAHEVRRVPLGEEIAA